MTIRPALPRDRAALYEVCRRTGDVGRDASALHADPELLGHVWAGPYLALEPQLAFVVEDDEGVAGYVLGARDTTVFEERCEAEWWPALRRRYPDPDEVPGVERTPDQQLQHWIHHPPRTTPELVRRYPSHLHIDLLPRTQGRGDGRRLMQTLLDALREHESPGVHLGTSRQNTRAVGFYCHLGFTELTTYGDDDTVVMGLSLDSPTPA
jgi:ribosomal protein S18 acetylase RimI-like enzyme